MKSRCIRLSKDQQIMLIIVLTTFIELSIYPDVNKVASEILEKLRKS